jgi:hypothetical protein
MSENVSGTGIVLKLLRWFYCAASAEKDSYAKDLLHMECRIQKEKCSS